jgi:hypothetical protein
MIRSFEKILSNDYKSGGILVPGISHKPNSTYAAEKFAIKP